MPMRAGQLRHRLTLFRIGHVRDTQGAGILDVEQYLGEAWGRVVPMSGREFAEASQVQAETTHEITIRYFNGLTTKDRVYFGERKFEIVGIANREERNEMMTLQCVERTSAN